VARQFGSRLRGSSSDPGASHRLRNRWFARLPAGGRRIRTFGSGTSREHFLYALEPGPARLWSQSRILTGDNAKIIVRRAGLATAMISTPSHRVSGRRQREASAAWRDSLGKQPQAAIDQTRAMECLAKRKTRALHATFAPVPANNEWCRRLAKHTVARNQKFASISLRRRVRLRLSPPMRISRGSRKRWPFGLPWGKASSQPGHRGDLGRQKSAKPRSLVGRTR